MFASIAFVQEDDIIRAYEALEDFIVQLAISSYFSLDYCINPKELQMESGRLIIKSKANIMHLLSSERILVDFKIDTVHM
ncbi:hypothetical protein HZS_3426 [Henneguya salminicola]|nr:hypothetical protein HZS_3426 [Henneguya salminicola]